MVSCTHGVLHTPQSLRTRITKSKSVICTSTYKYILVCQYILVRTGMYKYILVQVCTGIRRYILVHTGMYMYVPYSSTY